MKSGIELIAEERQRQITAEGWTAEHDDEHKGAEMADASAVYASAAGAIARGADPIELHDSSEGGWSVYIGIDAQINWPWDEKWLKLSRDPIRNLVRAGALIAAEIDRLQRLNAEDSPPKGETGEGQS
jgi:hypothetical protein